MADDTRRRRGMAVAAIALAATLPFLGTLGHGFALDDAPEIVRNDHVRSLAHLPEIFASGAWTGAGEANPIYRPLTTATYALNHAACGLAPAGFHAVNVLLHAAVSVLVLLLGLRLGLPLAAAALGAALFAVHPVHVEVVANLAGRKDALATLFTLAAVLAHDAALRRGGAARLALPVLLAAAALFSKESGAAAIGAAVAWTVLVDRGPWRGARTRVIALFGAYAAVFALYLAARRAAVGSFGVPLAFVPYLENPLAHEDAATRLLTAVAVLGRGLALLVWPGTLSPDYSWSAIPLVRSALDPSFLAALATVALLAVAAWVFRRRHHALAFCGALYGLGIFPASNLAVKVGTTFGERLLYLPSVGFCLAAGALAAAGLGRLRARALAAAWLRPAAAALAAVVLGALAARTVAYAAAWRDEVALFEHAVRAQPASAKVWQLLGAALMEVDRVDEGVAALERAVAMQRALPAPPEKAAIELGVAYERQGRLAEAAALYGEVLARAPAAPDALWRLGVVRWREARREEATALWQRTLAADPGHAAATSDLGIAALELRGDAAEAERLWRRAAELDPRAAGPWLHLGTLYLRRGEADRTREAWRRFLELARYGVHPGQREAVETWLREADAAASRGGGH